MKNTFVYTHTDGTEELVEYDTSICTEEDAKTISINMDKFYDKYMQEAKNENI